MGLPVVNISPGRQYQLVLPNIFYVALCNTWYCEWTLYAISLLSVTKQDTIYLPQNVDSYN